MKGDFRKLVERLLKGLFTRGTYDCREPGPTVLNTWGIAPSKLESRLVQQELEATAPGDQVPEEPVLIA